MIALTDKIVESIKLTAEQLIRNTTGQNQWVVQLSTGKFGKKKYGMKEYKKNGCVTCIAGGIFNEKKDGQHPPHHKGEGCATIHDYNTY